MIRATMTHCAEIDLIWDMTKPCWGISVTVCLFRHRKTSGYDTTDRVKQKPAPGKPANIEASTSMSAYSYHVSEPQRILHMLVFTCLFISFHKIRCHSTEALAARHILVARWWFSWHVPCLSKVERQNRRASTKMSKKSLTSRTAGVSVRIAFKERGDARKRREQ